MRITKSFFGTVVVALVLSMSCSYEREKLKMTWAGPHRDSPPHLGDIQR